MGIWNFIGWAVVSSWIGDLIAYLKYNSEEKSDVPIDKLVRGKAICSIILSAIVIISISKLV